MTQNGPIAPDLPKWLYCSCLRPKHMLEMGIPQKRTEEIEVFEQLFLECRFAKMRIYSISILCSNSCVVRTLHHVYSVWLEHYSKYIPSGQNTTACIFRVFRTLQHVRIFRVVRTLQNVYSVWLEHYSMYIPTYNFPHALRHTWSWPLCLICAMKINNNFLNT